MSIRNLGDIRITSAQRTVLDLVADHQTAQGEPPTVDAILLTRPHEIAGAMRRTIDDLVRDDFLEKGRSAEGNDALHLTPTGLLMCHRNGDASACAEAMLLFFQRRLQKEGSNFRTFAWADLKAEGVAEIDEELPLVLTVVRVLNLAVERSYSLNPPAAEWNVPRDIVDFRGLSEIRDLYARADRSRTASAKPAARAFRDQMNNNNDHFDVLLVVATDVENDALTRAAEAQTGVAQPRALVHRPHRTYKSLGEIAGARVGVVQTEAGTATAGGSLATILTAIGEVTPRTVIMVGIAFGVDPDKQPIGLVLVSKQIQQYDIQRIGSDDAGARKVIARGDRATASPDLLSRLRASKTACEPELTVEFGLVLSGEKLVDNLDYRDELRTLEPEALGGEMEGGGLYVAALERGVRWCVVKGICDYADGNKREKKSERQLLAAANAAKFVLHVLGAGGFADPS